ncbi:MAG: hypothetical protein ACYSUT_12365 [Planctomycetota bacterium]|jgi:hypothetical protein
MGDAAHVGSHKHVVFSKPFTITPVVEEWDTPGNYRRFPGGKELPDKMKVWKVQNSEKKTYGGVVARSYGFTDSPDAEAIALGFNRGKEYGAVGIGRHGNFLQWGYSAPPSKMTEPGQKLFLNCICYIKQFDGKAPLVTRTGYPRENAVRLAALITKIKDRNFFDGTFAADLKEKYKDNPDGLVKYYTENFEFIYRDRTFVIDEDIKSLGLSSNRTLETLEKLVQMLGDRKKSKTARKLLVKYTNESFRSPKQWQDWFDKNKDRIFFSDFGGYKFFVTPEGYTLSKEP